jgi:hypothetical protein
MKCSICKKILKSSDFDDHNCEAVIPDTKSVLTINFNTEDGARRFAEWILESGENDFYYYQESEDDDDKIQLRIPHLYGDETKLTIEGESKNGTKSTNNE